MLVRVVQKVTLPVMHPMAPANWLWREKEGFGDPERIRRDNVIGSLHGERTAVMLISWEALGGDPGPLGGAVKGVMAAAGIGRACPSLDVRPQAPKETGCLVSRFPVPISEFPHLPQVLI